jgi:hypothetical protein
MRRCRYRLCRREFLPPKPNYYFCSWDCHQAYFAANDYRGYKRRSDESYDRGYQDAWRARPPGEVNIPGGVWKGLMLFSHPDKWQHKPGLVTLATEVTRWLLEHRPTGDRERKSG